MKVRLIDKKDFEKVAELMAYFRLEQRLIKGIKSSLNVESAKVEVIEFFDSKFPIYVAFDENSVVAGYLILRVVDKVVWVEQIYVDKLHRRKGVAKKLFEKAEEISKELGNQTLYNWILPNNDNMIKFLSKQGYNVLNMIEVRKEFNDENINGKIEIGDYSYKYLKS